jgi:hypothetical protein
MENTARNLMFDLAAKHEIFDDAENRVISKAEANEAVRKVCFEELGISANSTEKQIKRALKSEKATALFEVIEEVIEQEIEYGFRDNEFFNEFVETRNLADGDRTDFWADDDIILNVAKVSGDQHSYTIQRLGAGSSYTVPTSRYAVKVGNDIRLFLTGRKDWSELIDAVAKAYINKIQNELYAEFMNAASQLPVTAGFTGTGALSKDKKDDFDEIISNVATANNSGVVIMGTKTALKKLNALADVDWVAESQKEAVANTGILGSYEGVTLLEIPQRFKDNKLAEKLVDPTVLLIFPVVDYKPVKFIDGGETTLEVTEAGDNADDMQTYEAQRRMGIGTIITRQFGQWDLDA